LETVPKLSCRSRRLPSIKLTGRRDGGGGRRPRVGFKTSRLASAVSSTSMSGAGQTNVPFCELKVAAREGQRRGSSKNITFPLRRPCLLGTTPGSRNARFAVLANNVCTRITRGIAPSCEFCLHVRSVKIVGRGESRWWNERGFICFIWWSREMNLV
jgi:hypothetical protein